MIKHSVGLGILLLFAALQTPVATAGNGGIESPQEIGPWAVGRTTFGIVDPARNDRPLLVDVWYPVDANDTGGVSLSEYDLVFATLQSAIALHEPPVSTETVRPLIVFSHGSGGIRYQSFFLTEALASHGFIVVAPDHTGNTAADLVFGTAVPLQQSALDRPQDISFVITQMLAKNADPDDAFAGTIDSTRIGVTGHSFGGFTSLAMASGYQAIPPDRRVAAIAPFAPASGVLGDIELASIGIPTLILGGTADITTPIDPESTRPWSLLPAHPRFRVDILDGGHQSFSDICVIADALLSTGIPPDVIDFLLGNVDEGCAPELIAFEEAHRLSRLYVVAFLKRYVANELQYRRFLNSGYANSHDLPVDFFQGTANGQPGENTP